MKGLHTTAILLLIKKMRYGFMSMNVSGGFDSSAKKASLTDLKIAAQKKHEVSSSDQKITEVVMHTGFLGAFLNLVTRNYQAISMKDAKGDAKIFYVSIHSLSDKLDISPPDCRELLKHFGDWEKLTRTVNQVDEFIKKELEQRPHLDSRQKWFLEFVLKSFRAQFLHVASGTDDRDFKWDRLGIEIEKKEGKFMKHKSLAYLLYFSLNDILISCIVFILFLILK
jgi:hypothetical protein